MDIPRVLAWEPYQQRDGSWSVRYRLDVSPKWWHTSGPYLSEQHATDAFWGREQVLHTGRVDSVR